MSSANTDTSTTSWAGRDRLPTTELRALWIKTFAANTAPKLKRELLIATLAYQLQADQLGGLSAATLRRLKGYSPASDDTAPPTSLSRGTELKRVWRGTTHTVRVCQDGFEWNGRDYRSLSAIAREITGTRWSGPRFFGLDRPQTPGAGN